MAGPKATLIIPPLPADLHPVGDHSTSGGDLDHINARAEPGYIYFVVGCAWNSGIVNHLPENTDHPEGHLISIRS